MGYTFNHSYTSKNQPKHNKQYSVYFRQGFSYTGCIFYPETANTGKEQIWFKEFPDGGNYTQILQLMTMASGLM